MKIQIEQKKEILKWVVILVTAWILFSLTGCYTEKKAVSQVTKAIEKKPLSVLPIFRGKFPCVTTNSDTTIFTTDTTIYVDCPDTIVTGEYFSYHDTVIIQGKTVIKEGKTIKVPVTLPVKTVTVVKTIEDLSRVAEMDIKLTAMQNDRDKWHGKNDHKGKVIKWLIFILVGLSIPYIIKLVKLIMV